MNRTSLPKTLVAIFFCTLLATPAALAQKSQKAEKTRATQSVGTFKEMLAKHAGKQTNMGKLVKVGTDYITVESDEAATMIVLHAVLSFKVLKDEETSEERLEIVLAEGD